MSDVRVLDWDALRAAADPVGALRDALAVARDGEDFVLTCDIAPDDPSERAGIEAVLRLCRPDARCPSTRGEVLAVVFGARCSVRHERAAPLPTRPVVPEHVSPAARAFLESWLTEPPVWAPGGALPLIRAEFLLTVTIADLASAPGGA